MAVGEQNESNGRSAGLTAPQAAPPPQPLPAALPRLVCLRLAYPPADIIHYAGWVGWVARYSQLCLVPSNLMLHQYTRTSAPVSAARAQQRPSWLTLRTQTPQGPTSLDCHQDASMPAAQILCIPCLTSSLGSVFTTCGSICASACCSGLGHAAYPGAAAASSSHWSMSIATSSASGLCSMLSSSALLRFFLPPV